ncbi:MAG TPA: phosphoesterase [Verrucomicrobiae bacterium]|jgi:DNA-binding beta-propeller fold protein YncE|nr:phosphoesterase [Verrucomicrobiae bacterium]
MTKTILGLSMAAALAACAAAQETGDNEQVRRLADERLITPVNQIVAPSGRQVPLPGLRPQGLALSPDGALLVTSGKTHHLVVIDPGSGKILQEVLLPGDDVTVTNQTGVSPRQLFGEDEGQLSFTGLIFSPDGRRIYLSNVGGSVKVFLVETNRVSPGYSIPLPPANAPRRKDEVPAGLAMSKDGKRLYVALNMGNRVAEVDVETSAILRTWEVGVAPFDVALAGRKLYVSNWGGRRPVPGSLTGPAGRGTVVRVDPVRYIANEGSVSVIDLKENRVTAEILTGLHASALAMSPNQRHLVVANASSDTLSVIDTKSDAIVETLCARQDPGDLFGACPDAVAFDASGRELYVCNAAQNAVAIFDFKAGASRLKGLVPVGWFPGAVVWDQRRRAIEVANIKGMSAGRVGKTSGRLEFNTHQHLGSVTLVERPNTQELAADTARALHYMRYPRLKEAAQPARPGQPPRPVPERVGEPSVFQHVLYLIKENRTYDQVLGDIKEGNGAADLCTFGERVTPNQHKFCRDFVLLDNTYCSGILSADGHEWATTAFATDYMERLFAGFPRSYPDGCDDDEVDALAYAPTGFIWDNCLAHGKTIRDYGEFAITRKAWADHARKGAPKFLDAYHEFLHPTGAIAMHSDPGVESLRAHLDAQYIGWDLNVPDVQRSAEFVRELRQCEQQGALPNFMIFSLPNDHTSGADPGSPTPAAQVADNDLAFGQIVDAVSHSRFWSNTCIFAIEDDPQAGWDHVSGYRTTAYVISAYCKRQAVVSVQYNQLSLIRTMELVLGLPPMNQMDATATPMSACFNDTPDLRPYDVVTNNIPLDKMNPDPKKISNAELRHDAYVSARLPLSKPDQCPEDVLNRILWRAVQGPQVPYPEWAVTALGDDD